MTPKKIVMDARENECQISQNYILYTWNFQNFTCDTNHNSIDSTKRDLTRAVASGGQGGHLPLPPEPIEPDTSNFWMDLFSLDSLILIIVTSYPKL